MVPEVSRNSSVLPSGSGPGPEHGRGVKLYGLISIGCKSASALSDVIQGISLQGAVHGLMKVRTVIEAEYLEARKIVHKFVSCNVGFVPSIDDDVGCRIHCLHDCIL